MSRQQYRYGQSGSVVSEAPRIGETACRQQAASTIQPGDQSGIEQTHSTHKCVQHPQTTSMNAGSQQLD